LFLETRLVPLPYYASGIGAYCELLATDIGSPNPSSRNTSASDASAIGFA